MSRYATKRELLDVIRVTVETDHNHLGITRVNMAGLIRDVGIIGDGQYGWTMEAGPADFVAAIRRHALPAVLVGEIGAMTAGAPVKGRTFFVRYDMTRVLDRGWETEEDAQSWIDVQHPDIRALLTLDADYGVTL